MSTKPSESSAHGGIQKRWGDQTQTLCTAVKIRLSQNFLSDFDYKRLPTSVEKKVFLEKII